MCVTVGNLKSFNRFSSPKLITIKRKVTVNVPASLFQAQVQADTLDWGLTGSDFVVVLEARSPRAAAVTHRVDKNQVPRWFTSEKSVPAASSLSFFTSARFKVAADAVSLSIQLTQLKFQYFSAVVRSAWKELVEISNLQAPYWTRTFKFCVFTAFQLDVSLSFWKL